MMPKSRNIRTGRRKQIQQPPSRALLSMFMALSFPRCATLPRLGGGGIEDRPPPGCSMANGPGLRRLLLGAGATCPAVAWPCRGGALEVSQAILSEHVGQGAAKKSDGNDDDDGDEGDHDAVFDGGCALLFAAAGGQPRLV